MLAIGGFGLCLLMLIVALGADSLGETSERISTVAGASIVALAHLRNMKACKKAEKEYA